MLMGFTSGIQDFLANTADFQKANLMRTMNDKMSALAKANGTDMSDNSWLDMSTGIHW